MNKILINRKSIREGIRIVMFSNEAKFLRTTNSTFVMSKSAAEYLNLEKKDEISFWFDKCNKLISITKTASETGFKISENSDKTKKNYRFRSVELRDLIYDYYKLKHVGFYVFELTPSKKNPGSLTLGKPSKNFRESSKK